MTSSCSEDDWLDDDYLCISHYQEQGREDGEKDGTATGLREGYTLGRQTAIEYGMEIGFIKGCAQAFAASNEESKSLNHLLRAIESFPSVDQVLEQREPTNDDSSEPPVNIRDQLQRIRARFKVVATQMGMPLLSLQRSMAKATEQSSYEAGTGVKPKSKGSLDW